MDLFSSYFAFVFVNVVNIGADLLAMSDVADLFLPLSRDFLMLVFALVIILLEVFLSYKKYANYLKYLCLILFAYPVSAIFSHPQWLQVLKSAIFPSFSFKADYLLAMVAFLGTTISPYLFFWQSGEEVEEEIDKEKIDSFGQAPLRVGEKEIKMIGWDTKIGMFVSGAIAFFIIVAAGRVLFELGIRNVDTAKEAALALAPLGSWATLLFGLGIIGAGFWLYLFLPEPQPMLCLRP